MDDSGPRFSSSVRLISNAAVAACFLACAAISALAEAGGVALWTKADSVTRFDRIAITPLL